MESLLATVRELLVRAVPTFLIFTFLYLYLRSTLFGPLQKVLDEREAATSGTKKAADEALKKAERKAAERVACSVSRSHRLPSAVSTSALWRALSPR